MIDPVVEQIFRRRAVAFGVPLPLDPIARAKVMADAAATLARRSHDDALEKIAEALELQADARSWTEIAEHCAREAAALVDKERAA